MACTGYSRCRWLSYSIFLYSARSIGSEKLGVEIMMGGDCKRSLKMEESNGKLLIHELSRYKLQ